jgi:small subunit ribosomal protein S3
MGQKVNPHGFRVGPTLFKGWESVLYAEKDYAEKLLQDLKVRSLIIKKYKLAQVSRVIIQRPSNSIVVNIHAKKPGIDSIITAQTIAQQLESRVSFRKAMKMAIQNCFKQGGKGIKVAVSGRLGGAEIARTEWYREGRVPLHTLRADIDYGTAEALTTYGIIGVKVWIYKGEFTQQPRR